MTQNKIPAFILSLNPEADLLKQWDFGFLKAFLTGDLWQTANWSGFDIKSVNTLPKAATGLVAIPARHHKGLEKEINAELQNIDKVVLFLMGDEEADFDVSVIEHPAIQIWVQNPHIGKHDAFNKIGTGFPEHYKNLLDNTAKPVKDIDIFFAGQITHERRVNLVDALLSLGNTYTQEVIRTTGFTQGESHDIYANKMSRAKVTPCPSGAVIPDSFRLFESLEAMTIPVADQKTPEGIVSEYWDWLFGEITPFPKVNDFNAMAGFLPDVFDNYAELQHKIVAWYIKYKRNFAYKVMEGFK